LTTVTVIANGSHHDASPGARVGTGVGSRVGDGVGELPVAPVTKIPVIEATPPFAMLSPSEPSSTAALTIVTTPF
jgi:hypothetical protein